MNAINQQTFSNSLSQSSDVESERPSAITIVDNLEKVMTHSTRSSEERVSELEHVAVLAYD